MPVYFHELPRPAYRAHQRKWTSSIKLVLINVAVLSTLVAIWLGRPQPPESPTRRTATIKLVPLQQLPPPTTATSASARVRPVTADPQSVGTITPAPAPPPQAFREVERAAPPKYIGFREIGADR